MIVSSTSDRSAQRSCEAIDVVHDTYKSKHAIAKLPEVEGCAPVTLARQTDSGTLRHSTGSRPLRNSSGHFGSKTCPHDRYTPRLPSLDWFPTASMRHDPRRAHPPDVGWFVPGGRAPACSLPVGRCLPPASVQCELTVRAQADARGDRTASRLPFAPRRPRDTRDHSVFARSASALSPPKVCSEKTARPRRPSARPM